MAEALPEPPVDELSPPALAAIIEPMPMEPPAAEPELPLPETIAEAIPTELPITESALSESDFDSATSGASEKELESWKVPDLPDIATSPEMGAIHTDSDHADSDSDAEPSDEMASHLDVPPLNLATPALSEQNGQTTADKKDEQVFDEQDIEAMLAAMGTPVTVGS